MYLTGIDRSLENMPGKKAIFVIFDKDNVDCVELKKNLVEMYHNLDLSLQVFFCIAIEEMEAWLLGDKEAVIKAYPRAKKQLLQKYVQDSIVGTWEWLADIVYKGGLHSLKRDATSYYEIGKFKCECAQNIGSIPLYSLSEGKKDYFPRIHPVWISDIPYPYCGQSPPRGYHRSGPAPRLPNG